MSTIHDALETYLALRRELGSQMRGPAAHLRRFVEFLDREKASVITIELALRWATEPADATSATWAQRLGDVRRFAAWLSATDSRTEVPPQGLVSERYQRRAPYIYTDEEVARIVREAARLPSPLGLRAYTYATLYGLLAATGLRIGEALTLDRDDVDLRAGILRVRNAKFDKSRFVPVHDSTRRALRRYAKRRDVLLPRPLSARGKSRSSPRSLRVPFTARCGSVLGTALSGRAQPVARVPDRAGSAGFQPACGRSHARCASSGGLCPPGRLEAGAPSTIEDVPIRRNWAQRHRSFVVTAIVPDYPCAGDRLRPFGTTPTAGRVSSN